MAKQLRKQMETGDIYDGRAFHKLPFEEQKALLNLIFGGKDEEGKRYGIYVRMEQKGKVRRFRFEAYGRIGNLGGYVETRTGEGSAIADSEMAWNKNQSVDEGIGQIITKGKLMGTKKGKGSKLKLSCRGV